MGQISRLWLWLGLGCAGYGRRLCYCWRPLANGIQLKKWSVRPRARILS